MTALPIVTPLALTRFHGGLPLPASLIPDLRRLWKTAVAAALVAAAASVSPRADAQPLAFPGAEGWAASTPGGRGGDVIAVTNRNPAGPGSFSAALEAEGPRTVVFDVGGTIDLEGTTLLIDTPFVTVAGQTAPYPGITLIDGGLEIRSTHDVVVQHIRVRPGAARHVGKVWEPDGITVNASYNVIVDHCSISWAVDENLTATGPRFEGDNPDEWRSNTSRRVTFSNNIVAEALSNATHAEGNHSKGSLIHDNTSDIAVVKNLFAQNVARSPLFKAGARGVIANNVVYNPGLVAMHFSSVVDEWADTLALPGIEAPENAIITVEGNHLAWGPKNSLFNNPIPLFVVIDEFAGLPDFANQTFLRLFLEDNLILDNSGNNSALIPKLTNQAGQAVPQYLVEERELWYETLNRIPSDQVAAYVSKNVGARPWENDPVDARILSDWQNLSGGIIDFETDVGGFPDLPATQRSEDWDRDSDGMPDAWERLKGLNPIVGDNNATDLDEQGFTNLEVYLNELSALRKSDLPKLSLAVQGISSTLTWINLRGVGQIDHSSDLENWIPIEADPSISGQAPIPADPSEPLFVRWVARN